MKSNSISRIEISSSEFQFSLSLNFTNNGYEMPFYVQCMSCVAHRFCMLFLPNCLIRMLLCRETVVGFKVDFFFSCNCEMHPTPSQLSIEFSTTKRRCAIDSAVVSRRHTSENNKRPRIIH